MAKARGLGDGFTDLYAKKRAMKTLASLVVASLLFLMIGNCEGATLNPAEHTIVKILAAGVYSDLSIIPADQLEAVTLRLRQAAQSKGYSLLGTTILGPIDADLLLLRLGDDVTMKRMITDYRSYDSMTSWDYDTSEFEYSSQPKLIPYLAEDFYSSENPLKGIAVTPEPHSGDFAVAVTGRSIFSGVVAIRIIEKSPEFSDAMKAWAKQAYAMRLQSPGRFRDLMRVWWQANRAAFARNDYKSVIPVLERTVSTASQTLLTPPPVATPAQTMPSETLAPKAVMTPTLSAPMTKQEIWAVAVCILVVLAVGVGIYLRSKK